MKSIIAIISDDLLFYNLITPLLIRRLAGIRILFCSTLQEINQKLENTTLDLILLDGGLTELSSIELIQHLRISNHITAQIWFFPEIFTNDYIYKAMEVGVNIIIRKPFDPYEVADKILSFLSETKS